MIGQHPAETGAVAFALATLIAYVIGLRDPAIITALAVAIGFIPAAVTWVVRLVEGGPRKTPLEVQITAAAAVADDREHPASTPDPKANP